MGGQDWNWEWTTLGYLVIIEWKTQDIGQDAYSGCTHTLVQELRKTWRHTKGFPECECRAPQRLEWCPHSLDVANVSSGLIFTWLPSLRQNIAGWGFPVASHWKVTVLPSAATWSRGFTTKCGGSEKNKSTVELEWSIHNRERRLHAYHSVPATWEVPFCIQNMVFSRTLAWFNQVWCPRCYKTTFLRTIAEWSFVWSLTNSNCFSEDSWKSTLWGAKEKNFCRWQHPAP